MERHGIQLKITRVADWGRQDYFMYVGQMMIFAGIAMIAFSVVMLLVLAVVFGRNKKKLIKKIYGEIEKTDDR